MFPDYQASLLAQQMLAKERTKVIPAADFLEILVRDNELIQSYWETLIKAKDN